MKSLEKKYDDMKNKFEALGIKVEKKDNIVYFTRGEKKCEFRYADYTIDFLLNNKEEIKF